MPLLRFDATVFPVTRQTRRRHGFTLLAIVVAVILVSWGGLVTSIDAGLAVPDWPTSFGSFDPLATGYEDPNDPSARWWHRLPILAEHGHRLLGALVGLLTLILAFWTWRADPRAWMRRLGLAALVLVIVQGALGGLRVVLVSLDLAVVHAAVAQIFFSLLVAMALFTSAAWLRAATVLPHTPEADRLSRWATLTAVAIYLQIILGALLRHFGTGVHPLFVGVHVTGAFVVVGLAMATFGRVQRYFGHHRLLNRAAAIMLGAVATQFALGVMAFVVLYTETRMGQRSTLQVVLSSGHLVVGAVVLASAVCLALLVMRRTAATAPAPPIEPADGLLHLPTASLGTDVS